MIDEVRHGAQSGAWVCPSLAKAKRPHLTHMVGAPRRVRRKTPIPSWVVDDCRTTFRTPTVWAGRKAVSRSRPTSHTRC